MLTITIPDVEYFDEATNEFKYKLGATLHMEHSLVTLAEWESKWEKPFLGQAKRTDEETLDYIRIMIQDRNLPEGILENLSKANIDKINDYIVAKMTATWFPESEGRGAGRSGEAVTAELIYYWMIALSIPIEFEHWHLNRLFTLIKVCNKKNAPKKKMGRAEAIAQQRSLNASRRESLNTNG